MKIELRAVNGDIQARVTVTIRGGNHWSSPWEPWDAARAEEIVEGLLRVGNEAAARLRGSKLQ